MSKITTHILDTSKGRPAEDVKVVLSRMRVGEWEVVTEGRTNEDGRILDWAASVGRGVYMLRFETKAYFDRQEIPTFYPFVEVYFEVTTDSHYRIPLLVNPYGFSTYRGS